MSDLKQVANASTAGWTEPPWLYKAAATALVSLAERSHQLTLWKEDTEISVLMTTDGTRLQVPPQAGPDKREGILHRMVSFFDQTLGRAARVLGVKQEPAGAHIPLLALLLMFIALLAAEIWT